jgi:threonine synthase
VKYVSTRGGPAVSLDVALLEGIAPDGGLYLPQKLPHFGIDEFTEPDNLSSIARRYLQPYFAGSALAGELEDILEETFSFDIPATPIPVVSGKAHMLELFHGPTAAFKDIGAGFLAACVSRLNRVPAGDRAKPVLTILVATSGDTGGAVAAAFDGRPGVRVVVLYPDGRVSARQEQQLTCWSDNVLSLAVQGSFDDCQRLVKSAMADTDLNLRHRFSSANSINIGRLLPQSIYYAGASLRHFRSTGRKPGFIVPTGNLGNAFACILAREAGLPIGNIVLATNANTLIGDYLQGAPWKPRASIATLASAMDVGDPSNMERLRHMLGDAPALNQLVSVISASDQDIENEIRRTFDDYGLIICPHTATAMYAYHQMSENERTSDDWILVATAHPSKFESIVEPLIGVAIPLPTELCGILSRPSQFTRMAADMASLETQLDLMPVAGDK